MQKLQAKLKNVPKDASQVLCSTSSQLNKCKDCGVDLIINDNWYACNSRGKKGSIYLCKKCISDRKKLWDINNRSKKNATGRKTSKQSKIQVVNHYGGHCSCCGEVDINRLTIDHVNGGGGIHRREIGNKKIYRWLKHNDFPDGYQVLCFNCNLGKNRYSICPHNEIEFKSAIVKTFENDTNSNRVRKSLLKLRLDIINGYGGKCNYCGESNPHFLSIDHINNDGNIERESFNHQTLYRLLKKENYPKDKYQLLCFNCNCSKGIKSDVTKIFNFGGLAYAE